MDKTEWLTKNGETLHVKTMASNLDGLAKAILDRAVKSGVPPKQISTLLGISYSTIRDIRSGVTNIPSAVVMECLIELNDLLDDFERLTGRKAQ